MAGQFLSALALLFLVPLGIPATAQERPKAFLGASSKPSAPARNAAQTRSRSQGVGILHAESYLADGWRTEHGGDETQPARLCRADRNQGAPPDVRMFIGLSYLTEALTEIGKR
jgi:hypothetical protein